MAERRRQASLGNEFRRVWEEDKNQIKLVLAKVVKVNPRFNSVDVESLSGKVKVSNSSDNSGMFSAKLPVQFGGRTGDGKPFGQTTPVEVGSLVLVGFVEGYRNIPVVLSVYSDLMEARELSRSPVDGIDPTDEDMKVHTQHQFTVYPSLTYEDIDGEGNKTVSFTGKSFLSTEAEVDPEIGGLTDDGGGTDYADLPSSYYYSGELIEPKNGKAPNILFRHVGDRVDEQGYTIEDDHVTMISLAQDGTFRTSVLKETEDWRSYFELTENGDIRFRRQQDSKAIGQGENNHEIAITEDGILFRSGDKYMLFNQDGTSGNAGFGGGNYDADIDKLSEGIKELGTNFEQTEEYIRMSAQKVEEIDGKLNEFEATFEITAERIEQRVTETVTSLYDTQLQDLSNDIEELNAGALETLKSLRELGEGGVLTPVEKKLVSIEWDMIKAEYPGYKMQAELVGVDGTAYVSAYEGLQSYVTPLLAEMENSVNIDRTTFLLKFQTYFNERGNLLYKVFSDLKNSLDVTAQNAINAGLDAINAQQEAESASSHALTANNILNAIASDDIVTAQEKHPLRREYRHILAEWTDYVAQAGEYEVNTTFFIGAKEAIESYVTSTGIFTDMLSDTDVNGDMLAQLFSDYYAERSNLLAKVTAQSKALLLAFQGDLEHYETRIVETSREISLIAESVALLGEDVALAKAELNVQARSISMRVTRDEFKREVNSNLARLNSIGRNLFVEGTVGDGELDPTDGSVTFSRTDTKVSPYIQVDGGMNYTLSAYDNVTNNVLVVSWYDKERNHISSESVSGSEEPLYIVSLAPEYARYGRTSSRGKGYTRIQFERGTTVRPFKASPEDMVSNLGTAKGEYESRKDLLSYYETRANDAKAEGEQEAELATQLTNDLLWTPEEKTQIATIMASLETWHTELLAEVATYGVSSTQYMGAYTSLTQYVEPYLVNMAEESSVSFASIKSLFLDVYRYRNRVYSAIVATVRESYLASEKVLDDVSESALEAQKLAERLSEEAEAIARQASLVRETITRANQSESSTMSLVTGYVSDNIVTPTDKVTIEGFLTDIAEEVPGLVTQANVYALSTGDLNTAYSTLSSYLSPMLTGDAKRQETTVNAQTFTSRFQNYFTARKNLLNNILDGANGKYEQVNQQLITANDEYRRRQDQLTIYRNAVIDSQFSIDRINDRIEEISNSVPHRLEITSSRGTIFRDSNIDSVITARMFRGSEDITDELHPDEFVWFKYNEDGTEDTAWIEAHRGVGNQINITHEDVQRKTMFDVEVDIR